MALENESKPLEDRVETDTDAVIRNGLLHTKPLPQMECMLYSKLPAEIRTQIFVLTLREFEDKSEPYRPHRVYYRPGFHYHGKQDARLLRTCRRIYQEARMMPVALTEFVYWIHGGPDHYDPCWRCYLGRLDFSLKMVQEQIDAVETIHLFVHQKCLERGDPFAAAPISCKKYKITIRHSDWWFSDSSVDPREKLGICPWRSHRTTHEQMLAEPRNTDMQRRWEEIRRDTYPLEPGKSGVWGFELQFISRLETLEMEFEVDIRRKSELKAVVDCAKLWRIPMGDESELRWTGKAREFTWTGIERQRTDSDYEDDSETDQDFEEDAGDREFVDLACTDQTGSSELTDRIGASAFADGAGSERATNPTAVVTPMRKYYVVKMAWDLRKVEA